MNNQWYKLHKWHGMDWVVEDEKGEYIIYLKGNFENIYWEQYDGIVIISSIHNFPLEKLSSWYISQLKYENIEYNINKSKNNKINIIKINYINKNDINMFSNIKPYPIFTNKMDWEYDQKNTW